MLKAELESDLEICGIEKPFQCFRAGCSMKFASRAYLRFHKFKEHNPHNKTILCPHGDCETIANRCGLGRHVRRVHQKSGNPMFQECPKCRKTVKHLKYHLENTCANESGSRKVSCLVSDCQATFKTERGRRKHEIAIHGPVQSCRFENCQYQGGHVAAHVISVHGKVQLSCETCGSQLSKSSFKSHRERCIAKVKDSEKIFACTHEGCGRLFATEVQRKCHQWNGHKPLVICPRDNCCAIVTHNYLTTHIKLVHENQKFPRTQCGLCNKSLLVKYMMAHMRRMHPKDKLDWEILL